MNSPVKKPSIPSKEDLLAAQVANQAVEGYPVSKETKEKVLRKLTKQPE